MLWNALNCPVCLIALCAMFRQGRTAKHNQQSHVRMITGALVRLDDYCSRALTMVQTYSAKIVQLQRDKNRILHKNT